MKLGFRILEINKGKYFPYQSGLTRVTSQKPLFLVKIVYEKLTFKWFSVKRINHLKHYTYYIPKFALFF